MITPSTILRFFYFMGIGVFFALFVTFSMNLKKNDTRSHLLENEKNSIHIFHEVSNYVVNVSSMQYVSSGYYSRDYTEVPAGSGSGFIWDTKGYIVTNFHVIQGADKLHVTFSDGTSYPAEVRGVEPRKDIAVLKIKNLPKDKKRLFQIADSESLEVGQKTLAIGSPFGLDQSLSEGIISATERDIIGVGGVTIKGMVQTDATINPGNSGGPLLDSRGFLIGMNTMIFSKSGTSSGIGFAVPSNTIKRLVNQIIKFGKVVQVGFGISTFSARVSKKIGVEGVLIREVISAHSGLKGTMVDPYGNVNLGDIIQEVEGNKVRNYDELYNSLEAKKVGDVVTVKVLRKTKEKILKITLIELGK